MTVNFTVYGPNDNAGDPVVIIGPRDRFLQLGTGAVTRTAQDKARERITVADYRLGSDPDDTLAFNRAIDYMNGLSHSARLVAQGNLTVAGSLNPITTPRKTINCYGATISHNGGTLFTFGSGGHTGVVEGLRYICPNTPTAGTCVVAQDGSNQITLRDICGTVNILLKAGLTGYAGGYTIDNVQINTINGSQTVIEHGDGASSSINTLVMTGIGTSRTLDETTLTGATATAIKFGAGGWDTINWDGLLVNGYLYGLLVDRTSFAENVTNAKVGKFFFDYCANGIELRNTAAGGGINNWQFTQGWVQGMDGYGVRLVGSVGTHRNIQFTNVHALIAGKNNWRLEAADMSDIVMRDCVGEFANRLNGSNTGSNQDDFVALAGGWRWLGGRLGRSANNVVVSSVPNWQARYGANVSPDFANWRIEGVEWEGLTADTAINIASTTITSGKERSAFVRNNSVVGGATAPSYATIATVTAPATTVVQTNNTPFTYDLYFYGGTVSYVNVNGITVSDTVPAHVTIRPGDTWAVTYSSAPTIRRVIHP